MNVRCIVLRVARWSPVELYEVHSWIGLFRADVLRVICIGSVVRDFLQTIAVIVILIVLFNDWL